MKRALVTGGSGDLGAAICQRLARDGLEVIVHANRNAAGAESVASSIREQGGRAYTVSFDVTDATASAHALTELLAETPVQVLVNNAGVHEDAPLVGMRLEQWTSVLDVTLKGFFNVTQPILMPMMRTRWGRIINMSSLSAMVGNRGQANYAAAKAGLHGATRSLAVEMASRGITVNTVAPGIIASAMTEQAFDKERIKQLVPMGRSGKPEEVAALVSFLASDEAGYISGQIIAINGAVA